MLKEEEEGTRLVVGKEGSFILSFTYTCSRIGNRMLFQCTLNFFQDLHRGAVPKKCRLCKPRQTIRAAKMLKHCKHAEMFDYLFSMVGDHPGQLTQEQMKILVLDPDKIGRMR